MSRTGKPSTRAAYQLAQADSIRLRAGQSSPSEPPLTYLLPITRPQPVASATPSSWAIVAAGWLPSESI